MFDSPRNRRLVSDHAAMQKLKEHSSIVDFVAQGDPPERYIISFRGKGIFRKGESTEPEIVDVHRCEVRMGIDYPRSRPDLQWLTPIYHPNISGVGAVCLGGYSTNWVPSLNLDELSEMLWDMIRMSNYDPKSAYNYQAAKWTEQQTAFEFPLDPRPIRDKVGSTKGGNVISYAPKGSAPAAPGFPPVVKPPAEDIMVIDDTTPTPSLPAAPRPLPRRAPPPRPAGGDDDIMIIR